MLLVKELCVSSQFSARLSNICAIINTVKCGRRESTCTGEKQTRREKSRHYVNEGEFVEVSAPDKFRQSENSKVKEFMEISHLSRAAGEKDCK